MMGSGCGYRYECNNANTVLVSIGIATSIGTCYKKPTPSTLIFIVNLLGDNFLPIENFAVLFLGVVVGHFDRREDFIRHPHPHPSATIFALAERLNDILRQDYGYNVQQKDMETVIDDGERAVSDGDTISPEMLQHLKDYSEHFSYAA
ncbi:unnamed protein product [Rotaria socialis]|uniref:Uncharacterized protein n=1 Tax=Rotaria socialis TaxID=392032 RepID=A0A818J8H4_9BILA|nr:unnamed protein product [Rotaria socialis]CAF4516081.1 unnamed protein product [Rotaria socialis]